MLFDVDQAGWGSATDYPDDPAFDPRYVVVHWGGSTGPIEDEPDRLRRWQRYHMGSKGWRDIAYNYAIGDNPNHQSGRALIYRCRGLNPGGHTSSVNDRTPEGDSYNNASVGVVWIGGANDGDGPSDGALAAMGFLIRKLEEQFGELVVKAHSTVKQENGSNTACPGDEWRAWIDDEGWKESVVSDYIELGVPSKEAEAFLWDIAAALGHKVDVTRPASRQLAAVGLGSDPRMYQEMDAVAVQTLLGLSELPERLYKYGKEVAAIGQLAILRLMENP